jgi:hypothetical protein
MTHCILTTDIELAKKLLTGARPDGAIIAALVQRGVDSASAAQLVADLRSGRHVKPQVPDGMGIVAKRRSRSRREHRSSESSPASASSETSSRHEHAHEHHSHSNKPKHSSTFWMLAAVPICFGAVIIGVLISNHLRREPDDAPSSKGGPAATAPETPPPAAASPKTTAPGTPAQKAVGNPGPASASLPAAGTSNAPAPKPH